MLDEDTLLWPGTNAHLMGRLAMIPLGPAAGNLWGSRWPPRDGRCHRRFPARHRLAALTR